MTRKRRPKTKYSADGARIDLVRGLLDGLGVEDIALAEGLDAAALRRMVAELRATGALRLIVSQARERAMV